MIEFAPAVFKIDSLGSTGILHIIGDIDGRNADRLDRAIARLAAGHRARIFIAFGECTFADDVAVRVLRRNSERLGARLHFIAPLDALMRELLFVPANGGQIHDCFHTALRRAATTISGVLEPEESFVHAT